MINQTKKASLTLTACLLMWSAQAQKVKWTEQGLKTKAQSMDIEIQFYTEKSVRIIKKPTDRKLNKVSLSVVAQPEHVDLQKKYSDGIFTLKTNSIRVDFNENTGKISFFDLDGKKLFTEKDYGTQFTPFIDAGDSTFSVRQAFQLDSAEAIYGLGQQQVDRLNQRNYKHFMRQRALYASVPIFQSTKGYGVFWDNYSPTTYNDNKQELSFDSEVAESMDYYFMYGGDADGVIGEIRQLTGKSPMFPLWTFGFWQSRERYKSQMETMEVVDQYRKLKVPIDGIIQDWQYWGKNTNWNSMEFENPEFPDPQKMIDHIHKQNAKLMISIWASFGPETKQYKELDDIGALFNFKTWPASASSTWPPDPKTPSGVKVYDAYSDKARDIYWKYLNRGLFSKGVDAWWTDSTEPDHLDVQEEDFDIPTALGTYRSVVNAFPLMSNRGIYEHQRKVSSEKRVYLLTRCAFAGQQRYGTNTWSGDINSTWEVLKKQIPTGLNFSLTGIPFWNTDIGGFFLYDYEGDVANKAYQELYLRWFQYGTFTPMQRSHGSGVKKEIYNLGKRGEWAFDTEEKYINLRYALLPYIYSTSFQVTDKAGSFLRALFMDFNHDSKVHNISDQYMFGKAFLVAPITDPMYVTSSEARWKNPRVDFTKIKTRSVYLPSGTEWIDFWTGKKIKGGQDIEKDSPIDIIPLYVRAGSILPFGPKVQYANEKKWDKLEIRIYPGADGEFILYEDENDNYNYEKGIFSTIEFKWNNKTRTLQIGKRNGNFPGMLTSRTFNIVLVDQNNGYGDKHSLKFTNSINYSGKSVSVQL